MKMFKTVISCFVATVLAISTVACTTPTVSNLVTALSAVSDAASVAVVVSGALSASNTITPADAALVATYANAVSTASVKSVTELNSTDTNVVKVTVITDAFTAVAAPALGPTVSPQIIAVVNAVSASVQLFINQLQASGALKVARATAGIAPHASLKLESGDKAKLKDIVAKSTETSAKAKLLAVKK